MDVFGGDDPDAGGIGCRRIFSNHAQMQAFTGAKQVDPADDRGGEGQVDKPIVLQECGVDESQHRSKHGQADHGFERQVQRCGLGEFADGRRCVLVGQAFAEGVGKARTEDRQGQAGDVLLGLEGDGQDRVQQGAETGAEHTGEDGEGNVVRMISSDEAGGSTHHHQAFDAEVEVAGAFGQRFAQRAQKQRNSHAHGRCHKKGDHQ